jgi:hypothetical protein
MMLAVAVVSVLVVVGRLVLLSPPWWYGHCQRVAVVAVAVLVVVATPYQRAGSSPLAVEVCRVLAKEMMRAHPLKWMPLVRWARGVRFHRALLRRWWFPLKQF